MKKLLSNLNSFVAGVKEYDLISGSLIESASVIENFWRWNVPDHNLLVSGKKLFSYRLFQAARYKGEKNPVSTQHSGFASDP